MLRIGALVLNATDCRRASDFWARALGYERGTNPDFLSPVAADGPRLHVDAEDRTHLDLWVDDEAEQHAEVERLIACGARRVEWDYPDGVDFVVLEGIRRGIASASSPSDDADARWGTLRARLAGDCPSADNVHYVKTANSAGLARCPATPKIDRGRSPDVDLDAHEPTVAASSSRLWPSNSSIALKPFVPSRLHSRLSRSRRADSRP